MPLLIIIKITIIYKFRKIKDLNFNNINLIHQVIRKDNRKNKLK
jgi:hypothetical protein